MRTDERKTMMAEVRVQVGGVKRSYRGHLSRSAGRGRLKVKGHLQEAGQSLLMFGLGLLLASLYGVTMLFLQKQPLWFCVYSTLGLAVVVSFSFGLSAGARGDVAIMLPSLCSAHGRKFLLFLCWTVVLSGPLTNIPENIERTAESLLCGAELAANQTQELMQRAATPLYSVLDKIREIRSNAVSVATRVRNLIEALTDNVRHVARTLRNVLHFLVDIGDICNTKMGSPYRKCRAVFAEAYTDCSGLLGEFKFLCEIVNGFRPLCDVARAGELFCVLPSYIAGLLRKHLADPTITAFRRMKSEFDFNLTTSVTLDMDADSSQSVQQATQNILEEVSSQLHLFEWLREPLMYLSLFLLFCSFLRARRYRRSYLSKLEFDNFYISARFEKLDQEAASEGGASVLPLTRREARSYIIPLSWRLTGKERRAVLMGVVSVLRHAAMGGLLVALDFVVFWMLDQVHQQVKGDVVARAPVTVAVHVNGSGYASDIFKELVASFNILQGGNITVISKKCLLEPSEPDHVTSFTLGFLWGLALFVSVMGGYLQRSRRLICASYYPERELERVRFLRQKILEQRSTVGRALRRAAAGKLADLEGGGGGGGRGGRGGLLLRLPGGRRLYDLLACCSLTCLACAERVGPREDGLIRCPLPQCPGVFCRPCFHSLGNACAVCTRPLTYQEDDEEELDSSDDEQLRLWTAALTRIDDPAARTLMQRRISMATQRRGSEDSDSLQSALSQPDQSYQDQPGSDDSDSDASFLSLAPPASLPEESRNLQDSPGPSRTV